MPIENVLKLNSVRFFKDFINSEKPINEFWACLSLPNKVLKW